jgi:hypothetical protein
MSRMKQQLVGIAILISVAFVGVLLLVSALYIATFVAGILAPLIGAFYAWLKLSTGWRLWQSHGRFLLPDNAVRVIGEGRARALGTIEALDGVGGFVLSLAIPALVFGPKSLIVPAVLIGLGLQVGTRVARRRVAEGANPVDVLPPE